MGEYQYASGPLLTNGAHLLDRPPSSFCLAVRVFQMFASSAREGHKRLARTTRKKFWQRLRCAVKTCSAGTHAAPCNAGENAMPSSLPGQARALPAEWKEDCEQPVLGKVIELASLARSGACADRARQILNISLSDINLVSHYPSRGRYAASCYPTGVSLFISEAAIRSHIIFKNSPSVSVKASDEIYSSSSVMPIFSETEIARSILSRELAPILTNLSDALTVMPFNKGKAPCSSDTIVFHTTSRSITSSQE